MEKLTFGVISDLHLSEEETGGDRHTKAALALFAEKGADAVVVCGDVANTGRPAQYEKFLRLWEEAFASVSKKPRLFAILGNHEFEQVYHGRQTTEEVYALYQRMYGYDSVNRHEKIGGYHFIGLCSEGSPVDGLYTEKTASYLRRELEKAAADTKNAPIFVTAHQPLPHTTYASHWGATATAPLFNVLKEFPQAVYFGGHSHAPCETERSIWQREFTAVDVSSLQYVIVDGLHDFDLYKAQGFLMAEAEETKLTLHRFHCSDAGVSETRAPFILPLPLEKEQFSYTDRRKEHRKAPAFPEHAAITPVSVSDQSVRLSFPAAFHEDFVLGYEVTLAETDTPPAFEGFYTSDFFLDWQNMSPVVSCKIKGLLPNRSYQVTVRAVEDFGKKSAPITCVCRTKGAAALPDALSCGDLLSLFLPGGKKDHSQSRLPLRQEDGLIYEASNGIFHRLQEEGFTLSLSFARPLEEGVLFAAGKESMSLAYVRKNLTVFAQGQPVLTCAADNELGHIFLIRKGEALILLQNGKKTGFTCCPTLFFREEEPIFRIFPGALQSVGLSYGPVTEEEAGRIFGRSRQEEALQALCSCRFLMQKAQTLPLPPELKAEAISCSAQISGLLSEPLAEETEVCTLLASAQSLSHRLKACCPSLSWEEQTLPCCDLSTVFARSQSWQQDRDDKLGRKFYTKNQNTAEWLVWKSDREIKSFSVRLMLLSGQPHAQWVQLSLSKDGSSWQNVPFSFGTPSPDSRYEEGEKPLWFQAELKPKGPVVEGCRFLKLSFSVFEGHPAYLIGAEQVTFFSSPRN